MLLSDAGAPLRRTLHLEPVVLADTSKVEFDLDVPAPATLLRVYARVKTLASKVQRVNGSPAAKGDAILLVFVFEVDPEATQVVQKRYYALLLGQIMEGAGVAEMSLADVAMLPNGAPIAIYELAPRAPAKMLDQLKGLVSQ